MLILLQLAALLGRERDPLTALALALMLLLAWNPFSAAHIGLQLSFASVVGILLFFRPAPGADAAGVEAAAQGLHPAPAAGGAGPLRGGGPVRHPGGHGVHHAVDGPLFREPVPDLPLANLMTLWAVSAAFSGGLIAGAAGAVLPELGRVLALPVLPLSAI